MLPCCRLWRAGSASPSISPQTIGRLLPGSKGAKIWTWHGVMTKVLAGRAILLNTHIVKHIDAARTGYGQTMNTTSAPHVALCHCTGLSGPKHPVRREVHSVAGQHRADRQQADPGHAIPRGKIAIGRRRQFSGGRTSCAVRNPRGLPWTFASPGANAGRNA